MTDEYKHEKIEQFINNIINIKNNEHFQKGHKIDETYIDGMCFISDDGNMVCDARGNILEDKDNDVEYLYDVNDEKYIFCKYCEEPRPEDIVCIEEQDEECWFRNTICEYCEKYIHNHDSDLSDEFHFHVIKSISEYKKLFQSVHENIRKNKKLKKIVKQISNKILFENGIFRKIISFLDYKLKYNKDLIKRGQWSCDEYEDFLKSYLIHKIKKINKYKDDKNEKIEIIGQKNRPFWYDSDSDSGD